MACAPDVGNDRDPVVDAYKPGVDRTLLIENLKLTPQQRLDKLAAFMESIAKLREARQSR